MAVLHDVLRYPLLTLGTTPINLATIVAVAGIVLFAIWLARFAEKATIRFLRRKEVQDEGAIGASARLVHYTVLVVGIAVAIHTLGINLTALFTAGAVFAIAIGFAMQNILQNFVSGLILLVERTIKPEDVIEVEGRMVKVTSLGMRATVTRTLDAEDLIIPNSILVATTVKNFTFRDRLNRLRTVVGVSYESDMRQVRRVLEETTRGLAWRAPDMDPVVLMTQFDTSSVNFDVSVWIDDPFGRARNLSALNEALWFALQDAGITIAYPQLDLHLDRRSLDALGATKP